MTREEYITKFDSWDAEVLSLCEYEEGLLSDLDEQQVAAVPYLMHFGLVITRWDDERETLRVVLSADGRKALHDYRARTEADR